MQRRTLPQIGRKETYISQKGSSFGFFDASDALWSRSELVKDPFQIMEALTPKVDTILPDMITSHQNLHIVVRNRFCH